MLSFKSLQGFYRHIIWGIIILHIICTAPLNGLGRFNIYTLLSLLSHVLNRNIPILSWLKGRGCYLSKTHEKRAFCRISLNSKVRIITKSKFLSFGWCSYVSAVRLDRLHGLVGSVLNTDHYHLNSAWAYLKGVSSLTSLHYLWRSLGPFSLPCVQNWP